MGHDPGWYDDPDGTPSGTRWWDGTAWTEKARTATPQGGFRQRRSKPKAAWREPGYVAPPPPPPARRRRVPESLKGIAAVAGGVAIAAVLIAKFDPPKADSGSTTRTSAPASPATPSTAPKATPPPKGRRSGFPASYGGLGASAGAFRKHNPTVPPPIPQPGQATYSIDQTDARGRVVAYSVQITAVPPFANSERMFLTEGINLPEDARMIDDSSTCQVFRSRTLRRLMGRGYARATTITGTDTASIELVRHARC